MTWIIALVALTGTILNIRKDRRCFWLWTLTNTYWCIYDLSIGATAQAAQFFVYACLAVWGLISWRRSKDA